MFIFGSSVWESVREENSQETIRWEEENFDAAYFTFNNPLDETKYYVYSLYFSLNVRLSAFRIHCFIDVFGISICVGI